MNLKLLIEQQVGILDDGYSAKGMPIHERPIKAAMVIAKHCVRPVEEQNVDTDVTSPFFGAIYWPVRRWYERKYGRENLTSKATSSSTKGLALYGGALFGIYVPTTVARESQKEDCFELLFPLELMADEKPFEFLSTKPNLRGLKRVERGEFSDQISDTVARIRRIWNLLVPATDSNGDVAPLRDSLLDAVSNMANHALSSASNAIGLALYEARMCCELVLKIHLIQRNGVYKESHTFRTLIANASSEFREVFEREIPRSLADYGVVSDYRYGVACKLTPEEFLSVYTQALQAMEACLQMVKRSHQMNGVTLTMKKPVWAELGPDAYEYPSVEIKSEAKCSRKRR